MTTLQAHEQTRILVQAAARVCEDKKGEDTRILELDPIDSGLSDFFLITSALNDRQAQAIADEIEYHPETRFWRLRHLRSKAAAKADGSSSTTSTSWSMSFTLSAVPSTTSSACANPRARFRPAEFDAELKATLAAKTRASPQQSPSHNEISSPKSSPGTKPKKSAKKPPAPAKSVC